MSILIKGMEMPTSCLECRLYNDPWCMAKNRNQWRTAYNRPPKGERQNDCPLIELPPHGRLIDADAFMDKPAPVNGYFDYERNVFVHYPPTYMQAIDDIVNALTIIPAEEVYGQYTDTAGNLHWTGTHSGEHTIKAERASDDK